MIRGSGEKMIDREKIELAIAYDIQGLNSPLDILINSGEKELWDELLKIPTLRKEQLEKIYADKVINGQDLSAAIKHPNASLRMFKHISCRGSYKEIELMLYAHPHILREGWFLQNFYQQPAVRIAVKSYSSNYKIKPDNVKGLSQEMALHVLNQKLPTASVCQILSENIRSKEVRKKAIKILHAEIGNIIFKPTFEKCLWEALKYEGDEIYRRRLAELISKSKIPN